MKQMPQQITLEENPTYAITIDGEVINKRTGKVLKKTTTGYKGAYSVNIGCYSKHNQKRVLISQLMKKYYWQVNKSVSFFHKNGLSSDFSYWNYVPDPNRKARLALFANGAGHGRKSCTCVWPNGEKQYYRSAAAASREHYMDESTVRRHIKSGKPDSNGIKWYYARED